MNSELRQQLDLDVQLEGGPGDDVASLSLLCPVLSIATSETKPRKAVLQFDGELEIILFFISDLKRPTVGQSSTQRGTRVSGKKRGGTRSRLPRSSGFFFLDFKMEWCV